MYISLMLITLKIVWFIRVAPNFNFLTSYSMLSTVISVNNYVISSCCDVAAIYRIAFQTAFFRTLIEDIFARRAVA